MKLQSVENATWMQRVEYTCVEDVALVSLWTTNASLAFSKKLKYIDCTIMLLKTFFKRDESFVEKYLKFVIWNIKKMLMMEKEMFFFYILWVE